MNTSDISMLLFTLFVLSINQIKAQDIEKGFEPVFITVRTLHGVEDSDLKAWQAVEEEYFNKVVRKIDLIISHEVLINYFDNNLSNVKIITVFRKWEDIEKNNQVRDALIETGWPDEEDRKAFFEKQNSFYSNYHSDEIYTSTAYGKYLTSETKTSHKEPYLFYEKTSLLGDYEGNDSYDNYKRYVENVILKNPYIKAYHPHRHYWGADSREFIEMIVVESVNDYELALEINKKLLNELVPEKDKRKEFLKVFDKAITDINVVVYKNVPSLSK